MNTPFQMSVSPDFAPRNIPAWFIFNTWLQRRLNIPIHLELYPDFESQRKAIKSGEVDLIYANPFDASMLVREMNFSPVVRPASGSDECVVIVTDDSPYQCVEDFPVGVKVACTDDPDVELVGMIMLETADLDATRIIRVPVASYPLVAAQLLAGRADAGFMLATAFDNLSSLVRRRLKLLVRSQISDIHHVLLVGPRLADCNEALGEILLGMPDDPKSSQILAELGVSRWMLMEREDTEFMIDLMDTLKA